MIILHTKSEIKLFEDVGYILGDFYWNKEFLFKSSVHLVKTSEFTSLTQKGKIVKKTWIPKRDFTKKLWIFQEISGVELLKK